MPEPAKRTAVMYIGRVDVDLVLIAERIKRLLLVRVGEAMTEELAQDRAGNIAQTWPYLNLPEEEGEGGW
jgi:hypothetical protein